MYDGTEVIDGPVGDRYCSGVVGDSDISSIGHGLVEVGTGGDLKECRKDMLDILPRVNSQVGMIPGDFKEHAAIVVHKQINVLVEFDEYQGVTEVLDHDGNEHPEITKTLVDMPESVQTPSAVHLAGLGRIQLGGAARRVGHDQGLDLSVGPCHSCQPFSIWSEELEETKEVLGCGEGGNTEAFDQPSEGPDPVAERQGDVVGLECYVLVPAVVGSIG
jgi:hypothetical protein